MSSIKIWAGFVAVMPFVLREPYQPPYSLSVVVFDAKLFDPITQRLMIRKTEQCGGGSLTIAGLFEGARHVVARYFVQKSL